MLTTDAFLRLCRARDMLAEVCDQPVSIHEVAREAAMSPFHFIRTFHALFGETPHQFRMRARLNRAKQLLALGNDSVTDVCLDVGFASLGSFSDLFARRVGVSPSAYRRRARSLVAVPADVTKTLFPGCLTLMAGAFAISEKR
jgi:AraC-like DNA-binding protein